MKSNEDLIKKELQRFFTIPKEEIVLLKRQHVFNLLLPLVIISLLGTSIASLLLYLLFLFSSFWTVLIPALGLVLAMGLFFAGKNITEWNFHWYVVTSRKVIEICYIPLTTFYVNDILLDQVKTTEIDIRADGILNELLDMGDINITFDRPTRQEGFYLRSIRSARQIGMFLTNYLQQQTTNDGSSVTQKKLTWFNDSPSHKWRFSEDIFQVPRKSAT